MKGFKEIKDELKGFKEIKDEFKLMKELMNDEMKVLNEIKKLNH